MSHIPRESNAKADVLARLAALTWSQNSCYPGAIGRKSRKKGSGNRVNKRK
uniref:Uncharacterized protein n=1 Tax=Utricularia reniformis TaxID=192314 RepID=A0A1Y0B2N0_9LAMI|nr:hypothetical protein AEK19_MT1515 [Utricularia reniformis]ART31705.1 hypothetical protein AEK19_MT1515 [Utricularia reniformis]